MNRTKKEKFHQFPKEVFSYRDRWVALTPDNRKVLVSGRSLDRVLERSEKMGFKEPLLIHAPKTWGLYVLSHAIPLSKTSR
jgi:hypothetical protein